MAKSFATKKKLKRAAKEIISFNLLKEREEDTFVIDDEDRFKVPPLTDIIETEPGDGIAPLQSAEDGTGTLNLQDFTAGDGVIDSKMEPKDKSEASKKG